MAVSLEALANALRVNNPQEPEIADALGTWLRAARELVHLRAPTAPIAIADAAIIKTAGYWYDQETVSRRASFANCMTNSGALHVLGPWIVRRTAGYGLFARAEANFLELIEEALDPIKARLRTLEDAGGIVARTYTGYTGWAAQKPVLPSAFASAVTFQDGIITVPVGGPAFFWFAVPSAEGYPDEITLNGSAMADAWTQQTGVTAYLGDNYIIGVSRVELASALAGYAVVLEYD